MATNRKRSPFQSGTITNNPLTSGGTTLNSAALANLPAVAAPDIMAIVLDPTGVGGNPEIVWVTAHTASATSATITRGQEGTTARQHALAIAWAHIPTILDYLPEYTTNDKYKYLNLKAAEDGYQWSNPHELLQSLLRQGVYKGLHLLGSVSGQGPLATNTLQGLGWTAILAGTGAVVIPTVSQFMSLRRLATGATVNSDSGLKGALLLAANDWTLEAEVYLDSLADQTIIIGAKTDAGNYADENGLIAFRVTGTGNIIGVCDSAGVETTRDSGFVPVLTTRRVLRIEVRSGGTIVRFYVDGAQVGADVTTNIPTGQLYLSAGIRNTAAADKVMYLGDAVAYREVA